MPSTDAVQPYQVEAADPKPAPRWLGSPPSCVAATVVPAIALSELRLVAALKASFAGARVGGGPGAGSGFGVSADPVNRRRSGEPAPGPLTTPVVAAEVRELAT